MKRKRGGSNKHVRWMKDKEKFLMALRNIGAIEILLNFKICYEYIWANDEKKCIFVKALYQKSLFLQIVSIQCL